jgi:pectin methylesterase-like acyl-CoA thioesterase
MVQYHPKAAVDAVTKTVGSGKDFTTIQAAIDWFEARIITGACYIDADAGTYDEAVDFSGLLIAGGASLTLRGDTRVLAGLSFVDGAAINRGALANGGSGTGALSNAGANITVTGTITNPDFDADSWGSGDKILVYDNAGAITEHTIDSVLNNVITLTAASPAIGNDATAMTRRQ